MTKRCTKCKQDKPLSEFSPTSRYLGEVQYRGDCKKCNAARAKKIRKQNPGMPESLRRWRKNNPDKVRLQHLRHKYGLSEVDYFKKIADQEGKCAICKRPFVGSPHVDHNHVTGEIRGLLCGKCNVGLGHFDDDPVRLLVASAYLQSYAS